MHRDRVAREERPDESVLDEPRHVRAGPGVHERRAGHPDGISAALALVHEDRRHHRIIDGLLAGYLTRHEGELAIPFLAHERLAMDEDALSAILGVADGDHVTLLHAAAFADVKISGA